MRNGRPMIEAPRPDRPCMVHEEQSGRPVTRRARIKADHIGRAAHATAHRSDRDWLRHHANTSKEGRSDRRPGEFGFGRKLSKCRDHCDGHTVAREQRIIQPKRKAAPGKKRPRVARYRMKPADQMGAGIMLRKCRGTPARMWRPSRPLPTISTPSGAAAETIPPPTKPARGPSAVCLPAMSGAVPAVFAAANNHCNSYGAAISSTRPSGYSNRTPIGSPHIFASAGMTTGPGSRMMQRQTSSPSDLRCALMVNG